MHRSQRFGYLAYPLVLVLCLAAPGLLAQNSAAAPSASTPKAQQQENPQQQQARLAQEAQARIRARRQQRVRMAIHDTYTHKYEVYGGGGYVRFHPGPNLQHIDEEAWNGGFTDYLWGRLGVTADFRGYYGIAFTQHNIYNIFHPSISQFTFMGGPQYRVVRLQHYAVSVQLLAGMAKGTFNGNSALFPGTLLGMWSSGTSFSGGAAVPVDFNLGPALAFRISPNYTVTTFGSTSQLKNLGFTSGLVFRWGRQ